MLIVPPTRNCCASLLPLAMMVGMTPLSKDNLIERVREIRFGSRYSMISRIGKGGFGKVYLGEFLKQIETTS